MHAINFQNNHYTQPHIQKVIYVGGGIQKFRFLILFTLHVVIIFYRVVPYQNSLAGHHRADCETTFKWRFTSGPMMAPFDGVIFQGG